MTEQHAPAEACFAAVLGSAMSGGDSLSQTRNDLDGIVFPRAADRCTGDDARELAFDLGILTDGRRGAGAPRCTGDGPVGAGRRASAAGIYSVNRQVAMARKELVLNGEELLHVGHAAATGGSRPSGAPRGVAPLLAEHAGRMRDVERPRARCSAV